MNGVTLERVPLNPEHGHPVVALLSGRDGQVSIHCSRANGELWLIASGPRGGDRGHVVIGIGRADAVLAWLDAPEVLLPGSGNGSWMALRGKRGREPGDILHIGGRGRGLALTLGDDVRDEFLLCLREWATAAKAVPTDGGSGV